jgi:hypothetical protein
MGASARSPALAARDRTASAGPPPGAAARFLPPAASPRTLQPGRCIDPPSARCLPRTSTARPCSCVSRRDARSVPRSGWWHRRSSAPGSAPLRRAPPASRGSMCWPQAQTHGHLIQTRLTIDLCQWSAPIRLIRCAAGAGNTLRRACATAPSTALPPPPRRERFPCRPGCCAAEPVARSQTQARSRANPVASATRWLAPGVCPSIRRFDGRLRSPCTTTPSPSAFIRSAKASPPRPAARATAP